MIGGGADVWSVSPILYDIDVAIVIKQNCLGCEEGAWGIIDKRDIFDISNYDAQRHRANCNYRN